LGNSLSGNSGFYDSFLLQKVIIIKNNKKSK